MRRLNAAVTGRMALDQPLAFVTIEIVALLTLLVLVVMVASAVALLTARDVAVNSVLGVVMKSQGEWE